MELNGINLDNVMNMVTEWGVKVIGAILILIIGRMIAGAMRKGVRKLMADRNIDHSLVGFVSSLLYFAVMAFVFIAALAKFGIQTASFVAILGAAGFAIGMALQGTLANFASGVMILLFRPFKTGDFIEAAGVMGTVKDIAIFATTMATPDNKKIIVPNGQLYGGIISNFNGYDTRRVDMVVGVSYDADLNQALDVIKGVLAKDDRLLADPATKIAVSEMADSSVNFIVRPWVKGADYWDVFFDFQKNCKEALDAAGIEIPYPQTVVHMQKADAQ
ncbi:mechanosensitive ion channel family protein [bacterium]|nr:MAG: mechanosensitive ion channel family protein [bacterium]